MKEEYIFFRRNGKLMRFPKNGKTTLFRGLTQEYDPDYDKSKLDNPNGYESWTDSYDLAKEYAGENGYVYSTEVPNKDLNTEDIFDENGDRSLVYWNDKPVGLHGVEGEEFMVYTEHEDHDKLDYKEISTPAKKDKVEIRDKETSTDMSDLDEAFTVQEQSDEKVKVFENGKEIKQDKDNKRKQNAEMKKKNPIELFDEHKNSFKEKYEKDPKTARLEYYKELGYDKKPQEVSQKEFDELIKDQPVMYRSASEERIEKLRNGEYEISTPENSMHGTGIYFAYDENDRDYYKNLERNSDVEVIEAVPSKDAKIIEYNDLKEIANNIRNNLGKDIQNTDKYMLADNGVLAATLGYDGVKIDSVKYFLLLNREKLIYPKKENSISLDRVIQLSDKLYGANMNTIKQIAKEISPNWNLDKYSSDNLKDKQQLWQMVKQKLNKMKNDLKEK